MPFPLEPEDKPAPQLRAYFQELIAHARDAIRGYPAADPDGLHRARKAIKRLRSILRLCRKSSFKDDRKALNARLREADNRLSAYRDEEVLAKLLRDWRADLNPTRAPRLNGTLKKAARCFDAPSTSDAHLDHAIAGFLEDLAVAEESLSRIPGKALKRKTLKKGFAHRRKRLETARRAYDEAPGSETLHDWRNRLKDVIYQAQLLRRLLDIPEDDIDSIKTVESLVGNARDCDLAIAFARGRLAETLSAAEQQNLIRHATRRRDALIAQALGAPTSPSAPIRTAPEPN